MQSRLIHLAKFAQSTRKYAKLNLFPIIFKDINRTSFRYCSNKPTSDTSADIVDINVDKMMSEDEEFACNYNYEPQPQIVTNVSDGAIAPIDVNPWLDEEVEKAGTVDMDYIDKYKEDRQYPDPPEDRTGYYEFEGLKIWLPKRMLTPSTYRYRLDDEDEETLPDDIRICKFEKYLPTP